MAAPRLERAWTADEAAALPDDGNRYEVIAGALWPMTGTNTAHMLVVLNLVESLRPYLRAIGGRLGLAPVNVWLPTGDLVQPDVHVTLPDGMGAWTKRGVEGAPDIAIEVLSPSNRRHDTITKRRAYARAGIRQYWLVDPEVGSIEVLSLDDGSYVSANFFAEEDAVTSDLLPGWSLSVQAVFDGVDLLHEDEDPA